MSGRLTIIGLGPGADELMAPEARAAIDAATDLVGYATYLARILPHPGQTVHGSDNGAELDRARHALRLASAGHNVAVLSSGDAGVFAMASAVFEAIEHGEASWRALDVRVIPGISAMFAAAARIGAPLGHDFCAISLSDNLKPWALVLRRLRAAAEAGFVIALYNAASRARPWQLGAALDLLREILPPTVPVVFATAISRPDETIRIIDLAAATPDLADMRTLVLVGSAETRRIARDAAPCWLYTPRSAAS